MSTFSPAKPTSRKRQPQGQGAEETSRAPPPLRDPLLRHCDTRPHAVVPLSPSSPAAAVPRSAGRARSPPAARTRLPAPPTCCQLSTFPGGCPAEDPRPAENNFRSRPLAARPNRRSPPSPRPRGRLVAEAGAILGRSEATQAESPRVPNACQSQCLVA